MRNPLILDETLSQLLITGLVALSLTLAGCATAYHPQDLTGGYTDARVDDHTFRVRFKGNNYTSREQVERYLLYRCAELTAQLGYDHFVLVGADTLDISDPIAQAASARNYYATALIKVFHHPDNPAALSAKEVMSSLKAHYPQDFDS